MKSKSPNSGPALPPSDRTPQTRVRKAVVRGAENATMTLSCTKELKLALRQRAWAADRDVSPLVVAGLEYLEKIDWKGVPQAAKIR